MAEIKNIDMSDGKIEIKLSIDADEYKILKHHMTDLIILPCGREALEYKLTTGKLGNSNRVMVPKKMLERSGISGLDKKAPSRIFKLGGDVFMLIKIRKSELGIPKFKEE